MQHNYQILLNILFKKGWFKVLTNILSGALISLLLLGCGGAPNNAISEGENPVKETQKSEFISQYPWDSNKSAALEKLKEKYHYYSKLNPALQKDKEIINAALKNKMPFYMLGESLVKDKDIILIALKYDPSEFSSIDESLKSDPDIILAALNNPYGGVKKIFKHVPEALKNSPDFMLDVLAIKSDDQRMNGDFSINPHSTFEPSLGELSKDKGFIEKAVMVYGSILCELGDSFKNDHELALKAVKQYGRTVACLTDELRKDREIVFTAIKQDGSVLLMGINPKFSDDKEMVLAAINQAGTHVIAGISQRLQKDKDVLKLIKEKMVK